MTADHIVEGGTRIEPVIAELKQKVIGRYPEARFDVFEGDDPRGTYLRAIVDAEDTDDVVDLIIDRLLDLQVEEQLPLYFLVSRPPGQHTKSPDPGARAGLGVVGRALLA